MNVSWRLPWGDLSRLLFLRDFCCHLRLLGGSQHRQEQQSRFPVIRVRMLWYSNMRIKYLRTMIASSKRLGIPHMFHTSRIIHTSRTIPINPIIPITQADKRGESIFLVRAQAANLGPFYFQSVRHNEPSLRSSNYPKRQSCIFNDLDCGKLILERDQLGKQKVKNSDA